MTPKHVVAIDYIIVCQSGLINVMNEYFGQDTWNKQCQNVIAIVQCETIRVLVIRKLER
jgi:hypothetical protein